MKILWLDDDAPPMPRFVGDLKVISALSCAEAAEILAKEDLLPEWVVVDLIVPQSGWGDEIYRLPGLKFLEYVRHAYPEKVRVVVYSHVMNHIIKDQALVAGAWKVFQKSSMSLLEVLHELREETARQASIVGNPAEFSLKEKLRAALSYHVEKHFSSVHPFSKDALIEIYSAILVLESDEEKRMRAYQTLELLREEPLSSPSGLQVGEIGELQGLRDLISAMIEEKRSRGAFDVFICYNAKDGPDVETIAKNLTSCGILPWFDHWQVRPGDRWRKILEREIEKIRSAAVFVGKYGIGPWQDMEIDSLLQEFTARQSPVIPVVLLGAPDPPPLPMFLRGANWVDFREERSGALQKLIWGITGWRLGGVGDAVRESALGGDR